MPTRAFYQHEAKRLFDMALMARDPAMRRRWIDRANDYLMLAVDDGRRQAGRWWLFRTTSRECSERTVVQPRKPVGSRPITRSEEFHKQARDCHAQAQAATSISDRDQWLLLAAQWELLAQHAERNPGAFLVGGDGA